MKMHIAKKILKAMVPPIVIILKNRATNILNTKTNFKKWWLSYDEKNLIPKKLEEMVETYLSTEDYASTSKYWRYLNIKNLSSIATEGIENYRRTVAKNYFLFLDYNEDMVSRLFNDLSYEKKDLKISIDEIYKKHEGLTLLESVRHNTIVIALYKAIIQLGLGQKLTQMREPPRKYSFPSLNIDDQSVSQDSLASLVEWDFLNKAIKLNDLSSVIEIGAGSGRTAACVLSINPHLKYIIVDIPPALFVSHEALSNTFPEKKIFICPLFSDFSQIEKAYNESDIVFMMPSQMALIPKDSIDLFLAIDCLHEMLNGQIDYIFNQIDRLSRFFYMKCWKTTKIPFDNHTLAEDSYPYKNNWKPINRAECIFPSNYFEIAFEIV